MINLPTISLIELLESGETTLIYGVLPDWANTSENILAISGSDMECFVKSVIYGADGAAVTLARYGSK